ncbi:MAG: recombinase family protein [Pseudomonadota bacterium]
MSFEQFSSKAHGVTEAVIYARVSSTHQVRDDDGLNSQIRRCEDYAGYKGYTIAKVFKDDISGKFYDRPGMKDLLTYLRRHKTRKFVVIIDDISRFARGLEAHLQLRRTLGEAGGILESPSIEFGDDPDSILVENLMATVSQHQREKNAEQTKNRMIARVMNGYWPFQAPMGFKYEKREGQGKVLVRHEPLASVLQEGLEGFASGRFSTQSELKVWFEDVPNFPLNKSRRLTFQRVKDILTNPVYDGLIHAPKWHISIRQGQHDGLIAESTWHKIQARIAENVVVPYRANLDQDFILRGAVACDCCGKRLRSCWSKGLTQRYAYYLCHNKDCEAYGKSIPRAKIEGEFEDYLKSLKPTDAFIDIAMDMFKTAWEMAGNAVRMGKEDADRQIEKIQKDIDGYLTRIVETTTPSVIRAYEGKIAQLEGDKRLIAEKQANQTQKRRPFDGAARTALAFLLTPSKLWVFGDYDTKRLVLKLTLGGDLRYYRKTGYRTPELSQPFQLIQGFRGDNISEKDLESVLVPPTRTHYFHLLRCYCKI